MTKKLSRRSLLKMANVLAASGAVGWKPDEIKAKTDIAPHIDADPAVTVEFEQPFAPYYIDPAGVRELWNDQGQWIDGEGKLNSLVFDGMTLRKAETDD